MSGEHMISHRTLNLPAWTDSARPGLFGVRFGLMPFDRATQVSRQLCSCLTRSTCLWCIIAGCFVGGYPILLSDGTTWNACESLYRRRRPNSSVFCLLWLRAARDLWETLAPGTGRPDPRRKRDGFRDESVRRGFGRSRCVNSPS